MVGNSKEDQGEHLAPAPGLRFYEVWEKKQLPLEHFRVSKGPVSLKACGRINGKLITLPVALH